MRIKNHHSKGRTVPLMLGNWTLWLRARAAPELQGCRFNSCQTAYAVVAFFADALVRSKNVDIKECQGVNDCNSTADCIELIGSYNCICRIGFQGDGRSCEGW